jgi:hypothetical protein
MYVWWQSHQTKQEEKNDFIQIVRGKALHKTFPTNPS